jgi:hypothetical protein
MARGIRRSVTGCRLFGSELDADRPPPAPNNLATAADDGLRHRGKPELGPDRGCNDRDKLCAISGDVEHPAFETFDAAVE